ncbi:hypothetical protein [Paraliomyxa miuraensis]|uniref:hypothetical protein n=1 Tax=Paraliomyxa miuraensis TaxID=376150 RepID=UPI0022571030|nr:hypothetical protein [Paraliomyxa miuraensis]
MPELVSEQLEERCVVEIRDQIGPDLQQPAERSSSEWLQLRISPILRHNRRLPLRRTGVEREYAEVRLRI